MQPIIKETYDWLFTFPLTVGEYAKGLYMAIPSEGKDLDNTDAKHIPRWRGLGGGIWTLHRLFQLYVSFVGVVGLISLILERRVEVQRKSPALSGLTELFSHT